MAPSAILTGSSWTLIKVQNVVMQLACGRDARVACGRGRVGRVRFVEACTVGLCRGFDGWRGSVAAAACEEGNGEEREEGEGGGFGDGGRRS